LNKTEKWGGRDAENWVARTMVGLGMISPGMLAAAEQAPTDDASGLGDIIVTVRRVSESAQIVQNP
jgi:hypothetical protein